MVSVLMGMMSSASASVAVLLVLPVNEKGKIKKKFKEK